MPTFAYSGRTRAGQTVSGERMADSMDGAVAALRREQIMVTKINPAKAKAEAEAKKEKTAAKGTVGKKLAANGELRQCAVTQWFRFASGREEESADGT